MAARSAQKLHPSPLLLTPTTSPPPTSPQDTLPTLALMDPPLLLGHPIPLHIPMEEEHLPPPSRMPALPSLMTARETERNTPSLVAARGRTRIGPRSGCVVHIVIYILII